MAPTASVETPARVVRMAAACASAWAVMAPQNPASVKISPSADVPAASAPSVVSLK